MSKPSRSEIVLIVDDDRVVRDSLRQLLQLDGYKVETARDGQLALQQLRGGLRPCIILLDLVMPGMDGVRFRAEQLRDPALAEIPIVVCSGANDLQENARALGAVASIRKPADIRTLLQLIETHCARQ